MKKNAALLAGAAAVALSCATWWAVASASDHDDGVSDLKSQDTNLTDLFVFREDNQTGNAGDAGNLVLIMNSNPRSLAGQQYYFSTQAQYEFHVTRVAQASLGAAATGNSDLTLRFTFGAPDTNGHQPITYTLVRGSTAEAPVSAGTTATWGESHADTGAPVAGNTFTSDGASLKVFAGLREDPFFFDVQSFFKLREDLLNQNTPTGFLGTADAPDFTHGYNVNAIVLSVPISYLQSSAAETGFDVWETVNIPQTSYTP